MKFNFKKITSVIASAVMLGSTIAGAMAAAYPSPFVDSGTATGAVIVGANAATSDWQAAIDLSQDLNSLVSSSSTSASASVTGEAYPLFTSGTKIYFNESINSVRSTLSSSELPIILADNTFSGNIEATITQTIDISPNPRFIFDKVPTNSEDPKAAIALGTTFSNYIYNTTISFNKAINFTHTDSEGEALTLFGQKFTIGSATDDDTLVLFKSSETLSLSVGGEDANPSQVVTIEGKEYTVELTSASDTTATVKVTDSTGKSDTKEITEASSKKVLDLDVGVNIADESTALSRASAEVIVGAKKITLEDGNEVTVGSDDDPIDGSKVGFNGNLLCASNFTKLTLSIAAPGSDVDAIQEGKSFVDPVFGTFKINFAGLNVPADSNAREEISIGLSGNDHATLSLTDNRGKKLTSFEFYNNESTAALKDSNENAIRVREMATINESAYAIVGVDDEGRLIKLKNVYNSSSGYSKSTVSFEDVLSGDTIDATLSADGLGTVLIGGKSFTVHYVDARDTDNDEYVRLDYPDSTNANTMVAYPTIETSKGAKLAFYEPITVNASNWNSQTEQADLASTNLSTIKFPDGKDYGTDVDIIWAAKADAGDGGAGIALNISGGSAVTTSSKWFFLNSTATSGINNTIVNIGKVKYNFTAGGGQSLKIYLLDPDASGNVDDPGLILFEGEDDNNNYEAIVVKFAGGGTTTSPVSVNDVQTSYISVDADLTGRRAIGSFERLETNDKLYQLMDLWGTIITVDKSDSDQYTAKISIPNEQIYAQVYVAEEAAAITAATASSTGAGGKVLVVKDSDSSSAKDKNLVVVGGSCINTVAAKMLGSDTPLCGAAFSEKTTVGAGQYLIKVAASPLNADKIAMLVAGYDADDTTSAAAKAKEGVATDKDTEQVYPIASA